MNFAMTPMTPIWRRATRVPSREPQRRLINRTSMRIVSVLAALLLAALTGCGDGGLVRLADLDPASTQIHYRFTDASVPPEYHRSYSVDADVDGVHIVVDSYADVLFDLTEPIAAQTWAAVVATAAGLEALSSAGDYECAGGTSQDLQISEGREIALSTVIPLCGEDGRAQAGLVEAYVAPLLAVFDMDVLLAPSN